MAHTALCVHVQADSSNPSNKLHFYLHIHTRTKALTTQPRILIKLNFVLKEKKKSKSTKTCLVKYNILIHRAPQATLKMSTPDHKMVGKRYTKTTESFIYMYSI